MLIERFVSNQPNQTREQAIALLTAPKHKLAVDIETVSLENTLPLGIGLATSGEQGFYFFNPRDPLLVTIFANTGIVVTHNGKFDMTILEQYGYPVQDYEDTKMIAYALGMLDNSLPELSQAVLHRACPSVTDQWRKPDQGNIAIDHVEMARVCMIHACNTFALEETLPKTELYLNIDKPCVKLLMEMEHWGLLIDQYRLTRVEQAVVSKAFPMEKELMEELGFISNLASNIQIAAALKLKGIIGTRKTKSARDSVSEDSLKPLNLPLTNKLLKWRSLMKNLTTYIPAFRKVDHVGRLHTHFGYTNTGRWSSSGPNHQNITRDEKYSD